MSKAPNNVLAKAVRPDTEPSGMNIEHSPVKKVGVSSFKINSVDQIVNIRRSDVPKQATPQLPPNMATERTSSSSYKPPSSKKKLTTSSVETERGATTGTISTAIGYITSPARYIGSFFSSKKEPMVVKSAPTLNKEKVKIISSSTDQVKDTIVDILSDHDKELGDIIPPPTILSTSNTTINTTNTTKKSEGKTDIKKSASNAKRSASQSSKHSSKSRVSPAFQKDKKIPLPAPVPVEPKTVTASNVQIAPSGSKISYKVTSKVKEEVAVKPKKEVRKQSLPRQSKTPVPSLTSATPSSKKATNLIDKPDEPGPTVLTCTPTSFVNDIPDNATEGLPATAALPTSQYPSQLKVMLGGGKKYESPKAPMVQQLANKKKLNSENKKKTIPDFEMSPTVLIPTCLDSEPSGDQMCNVPIASLASNNLVDNSPSVSTLDATKCTNQSDNEDSPIPAKKFSSPKIPQVPTNYRDSYVPYRRTSPQSRPDKYQKSLSPSPRQSLSPTFTYNTNTNFQPESPHVSQRSPEISMLGGNSIVSTSQSSDLPAHASYRVISPERFPPNFRRESQHKYRSVSRSPSRGRNNMSSYAERYNRQMNKSPSPNRMMHGRHMSKKDTFNSDNPTIIVMPSNKYKELAQDRYEPPRQPERITATQNGSYKVSTRPIETPATSSILSAKPNEAAIGAEENSSSVVKIADKESASSPVKELGSIPSPIEATPTGKGEQAKANDQQQPLNLDTSQIKPPCKGIRLKSADKLPPATQSLYSSITSGMKVVEDNILEKVKRHTEKDIDPFNSLEQYGGSPAQHAAASTMLGEFP